MKEKTVPQRTKDDSQRAKTSLDRRRNVINIWLVTISFVALFIVMSVYICRFVATNEKELINNSYNSRQQILLSRNYRGNIISGDGHILAKTEFLDDGTEQRVYPYSNMFSHVVGFSTQGKMGIEALANYYLINTNISVGKKVANDVAGVKNPGDNVYTTLNYAIQEEADRQLGYYKGAIIVSEPKTGKILAMVSHPGFDPNEISDVWNELVEDDNSSVLLNRATQGLYPPGSTFKIITALEYIRENPDTYSKYSYQCNGSFSYGNDKIRCYHGTNHGSLDFTKSFAKSCNSSFANIGLKLDRDKFANTLGELMFGEELPLPFVSATSSVHIPAVGEDFGDMMQTSIGQGRTQITPIHLNMITCAIANDGIIMKPYLLDRIKSADGSYTKTFKGETYKRVMSESEAEALQKLMTEVVLSGTGTKLNGQAYTAAGKTGSAEYNSYKGDSHAWFTGFAPAEDPQVCVTIIMEGAGNGGDFAVPLAKRIFDVYFERVNQ